MFRLLVLFTVLISFAGGVMAEVYKWKDEKGNWHFGDRPPASVKAKTQKSVKSPGKPSQNMQSQNLSEKLNEKYPDASTIVKVTLSVVAVETSLGGGSGFFVTDQGHIITNKHVVRPTSTEQWEESEEKIELEQLKLKEFEHDLREEKELLKNYLADLKKYREYVQGEPKGSESRKTAERELEIYEGRYKRRKQKYDQVKKRYESEKRRIEKLVSEVNWKSSMSAVARSFKIYLKDNTVLQAQLIKISDKHDLALLQVKNKITPKLVQAETAQQQGDKVFAIGSPLGVRDSVTSGIITRFDNGNIVTDAQILPGNSGGPLVNEDGEVIGVNTLKLSQESPLQQGFGIAIPIAKVEEEFGQYLH